jgi:hypothetical protein
MAEIVRIHAPPVPQCATCGTAHQELGVLCLTCRKAAGPAADTFVQSSIASAIVDLRRWQNQGNPLAGPVAKALETMRAVYDATEPRVQISKRGEVLPGVGGFWVHIELQGRLCNFGPYETEENGHEALAAFEAAWGQP